MREKHWRMTNLYEWTGVEMMEVYMARRTLNYVSSLARYDKDRWEIQMLGAEFEARNDGKRDGRRLTLRQHYWSIIQKVMPAEAWITKKSGKERLQKPWKLSNWRWLRDVKERAWTDLLKRSRTLL